MIYLSIKKYLLKIINNWLYALSINFMYLFCLVIYIQIICLLYFSAIIVSSTRVTPIWNHNVLMSKFITENIDMNFDLAWVRHLCRPNDTDLSYEYFAKGGIEPLTLWRQWVFLSNFICSWFAIDIISILRNHTLKKCFLVTKCTVI